jgi:hypothetical protein
MTARPVPKRLWRSYGNDLLPGGAEDEPFKAFPSWFMRIECDRCGTVRTISETHIPVPDVTLLRDIIDRMRHNGCGGGKAELLTGIEGVSSRPVRKIVLR